MINSRNNKQSLYMIKKGMIVGLPITIGYFPIAITYGVLAKQTGMTIIELTSMSVLVYAGASQFMGTNMILVGSGALEIIIATFALNFRHFIMSLSFMNRLRNIKLKNRFPLALLLTDETFAVTSLHQEEANQEKGVLFYLTLLITAYFSWVSGSLIGGMLGEIIPEKVSQSMGIALYAMFISLLVPSVRKEIRIGLIAVIAMLVNVLCSQFMSEGWAIVSGTILGGLSGSYILKEDKT